MSSTPKAERLFRILNLLRANKNLRAEDLAQRFGTSLRTIYRDLSLLSSSQVPIYFYEDGYKLVSKSFLPPLNLSLEELDAVRLALTSFLGNEEFMYNTYAQKAYEKISAVASEGLLDKISHFENFREVDNLYQHPKVEELVKLFVKLQEAYLNRKRIIIDYITRESKKSVNRLVDPYYLTFRKRAWYLVAFCHARQKTRVFRLDRLENAQVTEEIFDLPKEGLPKNIFKDSWQVFTGEPILVKILFSAKVARIIENVVRHPSQKIIKLPSGDLIFEVKVSGIEEISWWILSYGSQATVLEPPELRELIQKSAQAMLQNYQHKEKEDLLKQHKLKQKSKIQSQKLDPKRPISSL